MKKITLLLTLALFVLSSVKAQTVFTGSASTTHTITLTDAVAGTYIKFFNGSTTTYQNAGETNAFIAGVDGSGVPFMTYTTPASSNYDAVAWAYYNTSDDTPTGINSSLTVISGDSTPPVITLLGNNPQTIERGAGYTDAGATVADVIDAGFTDDLTSVININSSSVLPNTVGTYSVSFNVTDKSGNSASTSRTVIVEDTTAPVLTPNIVTSIDEGETALGTISSDEDVTWTDSSADVSVSAGGVVTLNAGAVLTNSPYTFTITATDGSSNATTTSQFSVTVNDITPPVISNVTMVSNSGLNSSYAKETDIITLIFYSNETINTPTVTIAGESATVINPSGNLWHATLTVGNSTTEGAAAFLISNIADDDNNAASDVSALSSGSVVEIDRTAPTGYGINALTNPVNPAVVNISSFAITGLEANASYNWSISDGNNPAVTGSGTTVSGGTVSLTGTINLSSLDDGTLTLTVYSTDQAGNQGADVTDTTTKDTQGPVIVLTGDNPQTLELNNIYVEQGVTSVNDNIDGVLDFTNDGGTIDTSALDNTTVGRYNIVYSIVDSRGNTGTATRVVHVMDNVPTTENDTFTVNMNSSGNSLDVLGNDCFGTAGPNTTHSLTLVNGKTSTATANGNFISVNNNGTPTNYLDDFVSYTPVQGFTGADSFTYTITDVNGIASTATVNVTVSAVALGYAPDTFTVLQDSNNNPLDVTANDTHVYQSGQTKFLIESIDHLTGTTEYGGVVTLNTNGNTDPLDDVINYTPRAGFFGTDTFRYVPGVDRNVYVLVTVTVTEVVSVNGTPTAVDDAVSVVEGSSNVTIDVLNNDSPGSDGYIDDGLRMPNGTFSGVSAQGGTISINTNSTVDTTDDVFVYTPPANTSITSDSFEYTITDASGDADTGEVTITITAPNTITVVDDTFDVLVNSTNNSLDLYANDIGVNDTNGNAIVTITTLTINGDGNVGSVIAVPSGTIQQIDGGILSNNDDTFNFTPAANFTGTIIFPYELFYSGGSSTGTVTINVSAAPPATTPTAVDDTFTVAQDSSNNLLHVLDNDTYGADNENATHPLTFLNGSVSNASANGGAVSIVDDNGTNKISYTPVSGFSGTDTIGYTITDSTGDASSATVTVTVTSAASLLATPTAVDDTAMTDVDTSETISVLANDTFGTDGRAGANHLTVGANSTQGGTTVVNGDDIDYTPAASFQGIDTFTYTIEDGNGDTATATVTVTVGTPVTTPTAVDDTVNVSAGTTVNIDVLQNDSPGSEGYIKDGLRMPNGTFGGASAKGGTLTINTNSTDATTDDVFVYSAFKGATAGDTDSFDYTITDASGDAATATVTITITAAPTDVPSALDDAFPVVTDSSNNELDILDNDSFGTDNAAAAVDSPIVLSGSPTANGATITIDDKGTTNDATDDTVIYTPAAAFVGIDTFTYTIKDGNGDTATATVTVTVSASPINSGTPTANNDVFTVNRYAWSSTDPIINLDVLADNGNGADDFGADGAMTAHNALNLINGKLDEFSTSGRRIRIIDPNNTPSDYSDDQIAYYSTGNLSVTQDTFTYTITDNSGDAATATVTINYVDVVPPKTGDESDADVNNNTLTVANEFTSYPNPSNGNLTATVFSTNTTKATLSLYDVKGMEVVRKQIDLKAGKNTIENYFNVKAGVMFLKIYNADTNYGIKKVIFK